MKSGTLRKRAAFPLAFMRAGSRRDDVEPELELVQQEEDEVEAVERSDGSA